MTTSLKIDSVGTDTSAIFWAITGDDTITIKYNNLDITLSPGSSQTFDANAADYIEALRTDFSGSTTTHSINGSGYGITKTGASFPDLSPLDKSKPRILVAETDGNTQSDDLAGIEALCQAFWKDSVFGADLAGAIGMSPEFLKKDLADHGATREDRNGPVTTIDTVRYFEALLAADLRPSGGQSAVDMSYTIKLLEYGPGANASILETDSTFLAQIKAQSLQRQYNLVEKTYLRSINRPINY